MNEDQRFALVIAFGLVLPLSLAFGLPLLKALIRRLEGKQVESGVTPGELDDLRARVAEVEELRHRVAELEERVDFSERLLAQSAPQERLKG